MTASVGFEELGLYFIIIEPIGRNVKIGSDSPEAEPRKRINHEASKLYHPSSSEINTLFPIFPQSAVPQEDYRQPTPLEADYSRCVIK